MRARSRVRSSRARSVSTLARSVRSASAMPPTDRLASVSPASRSRSCAPAQQLLAEISTCCGIHEFFVVGRAVVGRQGDEHCLDDPIPAGAPGPRCPPRSSGGPYRRRTGESQGVHPAQIADRARLFTCLTRNPFQPRRANSTRARRTIGFNRIAQEWIGPGFTRFAGGEPFQAEFVSRRRPASSVALQACNSCRIDSARRRAARSRARPAPPPAGRAGRARAGAAAPAAPAPAAASAPGGLRAKPPAAAAAGPARPRPLPTRRYPADHRASCLLPIPAGWPRRPAGSCRASPARPGTPGAIPPPALARDWQCSELSQHCSSQRAKSALAPCRAIRPARPLRWPSAAAPAAAGPDQGHRRCRGGPRQPAGGLWPGGRAERHRRPAATRRLHPRNR